MKTTTTTKAAGKTKGAAGSRSLGMPHSPEAEGALLGGLLHPAEIGEWWPVLEGEGDDLFWVEDHRHVWAAMRRVVEERGAEAVDIVSVHQALREDGRALPIDRLSGLASSVWSLAGMGSTLEVVRKLKLSRAAISELAEIEQAVRGGTPLVSALARGGEALEHIAAQASPTSAVKTTRDALRDLNVRVERHQAGDWGFKTGLPDLDKKVLGFGPGELIVIAARPSMGKTALAQGMAMDIAGQNRGFVYFKSLEQGADELAFRGIAQLGLVPIWEVKTGNISENNLGRAGRAVERWVNLDLLIDDRPTATVGELWASIMMTRHERGGPLAAIVIDYLQLMDAPHNILKRSDQIAYISRRLKLMAKEFECPVIVLSQLNRGVESRTDKRPMLSDLRDSGAIEQDADTVLFVYRDEYYNPEDTEYRGMAEIIGGKARNSGAFGSVFVQFIGECAAFKPLKV